MQNTPPTGSKTLPLPVRKAVFPIAGMGTRFLPATKASPKEMLPVIDKPLIQYAVEEAYASGIREMIFVTGRNKRAVEDHFDTAYELENELERAGKHELLATARSIAPADMQCVYVRQSRPLGLGHAVWCAKALVGQEPFAVILADDLMLSEQPVLAQLIEHYQLDGVSVLAVTHVPPDQTHKYGIVDGQMGSDGVMRVQSIIEKPSTGQTSSTTAVVGRYILNPSIFDHLTAMLPNLGAGEMQLTDAIALCLKNESVSALQFKGQRYDCGSKQGMLMATLAVAQQHPEVKESFLAWLAEQK